MKREWPPGGPLPDPESEVHDELAFYIEERARELEESGHPPDEARRLAVEAFGDVKEITATLRRMRKKREREEGMSRMIGSTTQDLKVALRGLRTRPGFGGVVIGTLALGIGAVTAILTVVNASLLRPLPFEEAERLVFVQGAFAAPEGPQVRGASVLEARDWKERSRSFEAMAVVDGTTVNLTGDGRAERLSVEQVGAGYFEALRVTPRVGRSFTDAEMTPPGDARVVLLTDHLWRRRYGADESIVGRSVRLNGEPFRVVGLLPEGFAGIFFAADVLLPIGNPVVGASEDRTNDRGSRWLSVVARLAPGTTVDVARAERAGIAGALEAEHPVANEDREALVTPMRAFYMGSSTTLVLVIFSATGLLLAIAAANVANLLLVRASGRGAEVHMRKALGASRGRVFGQFLTESLVFSGLGAAIGLGIGIWGARAIASTLPPSLLPSYVELTPDPVVFVAVAALMAFVGALAGLTPAMIAAGSEPARGLRSGSGERVGSGSSRLQRTLVAGEVALAILLLVGAGLMTRSFRAQLAVSPGFDHEELFAFRVTFPATEYPGDALRAAVHDIDRELEALPGVRGATVGSDAPLRGSSSASYIFLEGASEDDRIRFYVHRIAPDWFETLGTSLLRGRALTAADLEDPNVGVIGASLADRFFRGEDPVGRTLRLFAPDGDALRIVGVVEDVRYRDLTSDLLAGADDPDVYVLWDSLPSRSVEFVVRTETPAAATEEAVRRAVAAVDPLLPVFRAAPLSAGLESQTAQARSGSRFLTGFSGLATFLALVGLYGVLSFSVDRRRREIAIRVAVGAERNRVRRLVVAQGMRMVGAGLAVGLAASLLASRALDAFLFGVRPVDPLTYGLVAALLLVVALLAMWIPARRATMVDPQRALAAD